MKVIARHEFEGIIDATIGRARKAGEVFEVDAARANLLLEHHLIEVIPEEINTENAESSLEDVKIVEETKAEAKIKRKRNKK